MAEMIPEGQGRIRVIETGLPGLGAQIVIAQEPRVRWRLISLFFEFTTDATVVTRGVHVAVRDGVNTLARFSARSTQTAGLTRGYTWSTAGQETVISATVTVTGQIPQGYLMNNQMEIATIVHNMQAGDAFSLSYLLVEEWIEPLV